MRIHFPLRNLILPVAEINRALPRTGTIYEIGSGWGSLAFEIAGKFSDRKVLALDIDAKKVLSARAKYTLKNLKFIVGDARKYKFHSCTGFVLSDFLHHIDFSAQEKILHQLTQKLSNRGILILKEIDKDDGWRKWTSRLWDWILYPHDRIFYRNKSEWVRLLQKMGFNVAVSRKVRWFPGSTYIYICIKNHEK